MMLVTKRIVRKFQTRAGITKSRGAWLTSLLFFAFLFVSSGTGYSQEKKISYHVSERPLSEVLEELSNKHDIKFAFDAQAFKQILVSCSLNNQPLEKLLSHLERTYSLDFRLMEGTYIVTRQTDLPPVTNMKTTSETLQPFKRQISGFVTDGVTGEPLVYCNIVFPNKWGTITNELGHFYLETTSDSVRFFISHLGYQRLDTILIADMASSVHIRLKPLTIMVKEINVTLKEKSMMELSDQSGKVGFNPSRSANLPRLANDDLANMLTLIPGVCFINGATGGLSIRGGNPSENLILLDGIPLLETGHLFGNLSVLNAGFIRQAFVSRGAFDAQFGDRTSGLIELTGSTGSRSRYSVEASANLLNGDIMGSVPLSSKISLSCAWRRSYVDYWQNYLFQKLLGETRLTGINDIESNVLPTVRYQDINFKTSIHLSAYNEITINVLRGTDQQMLDYEVGVNPLFYRNEWIQENNTGISANWSVQAGKWHHLLSTGYSFLQHYRENESGEQTKIYTPLPPGQAKKNYTGKIKIEYTNRNKYEFDSDSNNVREFRILWKSELKSENFTHQFGIGFVNDFFDYRFSTRNSDLYIPVDSLKNSASHKIGHLFLQQYFIPVNFIKLRWGLRVNFDQVSSRFYWQPRGGIEFLPSQAIKIYYNTGYYYQFLSKVPKIDINQNVDLVWYLPGDKDKGLMKSIHHVAGFQWEKDGFLINAELYQKHTSGKQWLYAQNYRFKWQNRIQYVDRTGQEKNQGFDLLLQFRHSKWYHQLGWTWSKSVEQITGINSNAYFPSLNDHRHQLQWTELFTYHGWTASASWILRTGQPRIKPSLNHSSLTFDRLPNFSQLDAGFGKKMRFKHVELNGGMSLLNILNRLNVIQVDYLNISTSTTSFNIKSNISAMSLTPVFFLTFRIF